MSQSVYQQFGQAVKSTPDTNRSAVQACGKPNYDELILLKDERTGRPLVGASYRLEWAGGVAEGKTDAQGHTQRISSGKKPDDLKVTLIREEPTVVVNAGTPDGC
jgi:hypothetical protein